MPLDINQQGWNPLTTQLKQDWFSKFAHYHLNLKHYEIRKMANGRFFRPAYYHFIDATAGAGFIPKHGDTSPVRHAIAAERHRSKCKRDNPLRVHAHLIEENPETWFELRKTLDFRRKLMRCEPLYDSMIYEGRYQKIIAEEFLRPIKLENRFPFFGLLYVDPNGQIPEFELLRRLNHYHPRLDTLLHVSATNIKRVKGTFGGLSLLECMQHTGKRYWKIARVGHTHHQWAFLFGTNIPKVPDRRGLKLYSIDSTEGQEIVRHLNYTEKERLEQCA